MTTALKDSIGQFFYEAPLCRRKIGDINFVIGKSTAYNARGLIGPEHNGIFVLNETQRCVVIDRHLQCQSGYFGASQEQRAEFDRITKMSDKEFLKFVRKVATFRGPTSLLVRKSQVVSMRG